jgi:hypothetical protein
MIIDIIHILLKHIKKILKWLLLLKNQAIYNCCQNIVD